ncbi:hypothetical protein VNI00_013167 [Paramarasmius palmivorus]|uniref:F-box domain-containing protein n=1 Tax=Paramarasmius palmivorus TaxID=297713 RepID=A0AAW0BZQ2_9AGAR
MPPMNTTLMGALSSENIEPFRELPRPLSTFDKQALSLHLWDVQKDLEVCETHIAKLIDQRAKLQRTIGRCQSLLAPVNDVPTEILASIFEFCCHENVVHPAVDSSALILSKVCHRWRQVALSTPKIWSSLSVDFERWGTDNRLSRIVRAFVDRSRSSPLSIKLKDEYFLDHPTVVRTLEVLARASFRWFNVGFCSTTLWDRVSGLFGEYAPCLMHVRLDTGELPSNLSTIAPNLLSLDIGLRSGRAHSPCKQLKALTIRGCFADTAISMLQIYSRVITLETLGLDNVGDYDGQWEEWEVPQVEMPWVKNLKVIAHDGDDFSFMYEHLRLPQLQSLSISVERYTDFGVIDYNKEWNWREWVAHASTMQTFLQSASSVTALHIENLPASDAHIIGFLSSLPNLQTLSIHDLGQVTDGPGGQRCISNRTITSAFFGCLSPSPSSDEDTPILVPKLADLTLHARLDLFDAQALVDMVSLRWIPESGHGKVAVVGSLRSVELVLVGRGEQLELPGELELLHCLRDEGLRVKVSASLDSDCESEASDDG